MRQQSTLNEVLRSAVAQWGDKFSLDFSGETCTYRQLDEIGLRGHGISCPRPTVRLGTLARGGGV